ncbi:hypothetical protein RUM43_010209 [Polyplax serrata]|uniref:N-terminal acetyltransferase B complex subunit MDM20 homolog n=1 Tax=Polyplax serrata TaxID=468196 RepID=A0AAN8Q4G0_POLSC
MASNIHVDSRVQERRLRPIYDWLDSGNNKKALQEADKVLKKQPNFLCAKVLKALALQRLGKDAECEEILEGVCSQVPTDEATLQAIAICYRAVHKSDKICDVYSAASKKDPSNEELLTHLFMSYVRIGDYRKQHQHAMSLYKLRPKNPYYFWAVMSVVMQAKDDENIGKTVALKLAEKMVSKFVTEGKIEAEQEVQLYLMILEMQGKYEEALDIIEGDLGEKLVSLITTTTKRIELLIKLERWKEANVLLKCQLEKNPDSWSDYKNYIKTVLQLYKEYEKMKSNILEANKVYENRVPIRVPVSNIFKSSVQYDKDYILWYDADYTPEMALTFFNQLIKDAEENKKKIRGPHLAQLELYKVLRNESLETPAIIGDITELLLNYFTRFSEKPICVSDLKPYLPLLDEESKSLFIKKIIDIIGLEEEQSPETLPVLQKHIARLQLSRLLGLHSHLSVDERLKLCKLLINHYKSTAKLVSPEKLPTEFSCNDPYIILLSHVLFSLYQDTKSRNHIIQAIHYLEKALVASPSNFHFKLLLVKFYILLGAGQQAHHFYEHLEIKYIQLDSMGYLFSTSGYGLGNFSSTVALYDATLKFFFSNTNDSVDHLTYAYKYGSFMKIQEFIEFRNRLNDSLHYTFCTVEKMLHDLLWTFDYSQTKMVMKSMEIKPSDNKVVWTQLRDNRDLNVIVSYEPPQDQLNDRTIEKTFEQLKNYARLRDAILKCLCGVFDFVNDEQTEQSNEELLQNGDSEYPKNVLVRLVSEVNSVYNELKSEEIDTGIQDVVNSPPSCRLKSFLQLPVCQIISDMVDLLLLSDASKVDETKIQQYSESISNTIRTATKSLIEKLTPDLIETKEILERIVGVVEIFAITTILCGSLKQSIQRTKKILKKGKKKKEDERSNDFITFKNILKDVSECILELEEALSKINDQISGKIVANEVEALNLNESNGDIANIEMKIHKSYCASIKEIRQFLQEKQFYINTLKSQLT